MKQIESFLYYMRYELNYSVHTVLSYKKDLEQFAAFAADGDSEFAAGRRHRRCEGVGLRLVAASRAGGQDSAQKDAGAARVLQIPA